MNEKNISKFIAFHGNVKTMTDAELEQSLKELREYAAHVKPEHQRQSFFRRRAA